MHLLKDFIDYRKEKAKERAELKYQAIMQRNSEEDRIHFLQDQSERFLRKIDYFSGSLQEYNNLKGKTHSLIDLNNSGIETKLFDEGQFYLCMYQGYYLKDKEGHRIKDAKGKDIPINYYRAIQWPLIDRLVNEGCVGLIHAKWSGQGFFGKEFTYWYGYPVKEEIQDVVNTNK